MSWDFASFALFRLLTGAGIGGEYAAINSAIQELIPARFRGRTDLAINGSFWLGAALGALGAVSFLQPGCCRPIWGWRVAFGIGAALGLGDPAAAPVNPGKPALADAARPPPRSRSGLAGIERRVSGAAHLGSAAAEAATDPIAAGTHAPRSCGWSRARCATIPSAPCSGSC